MKKALKLKINIEKMSFKWLFEASNQENNLQIVSTYLKGELSVLDVSIWEQLLCRINWNNSSLKHRRKKVVLKDDQSYYTQSSQLGMKYRKSI